MIKLKHVTYAHTSKINDEGKDELLIPEEYDGVVAIESWEVNGELKRKAVCVSSVVDYILGHGKTKDDTDSTKGEKGQ